MITLSGTVRNSVQLAALDSKWQQKRNSGNILKNDQEMTEEERQLQSYQKQADDIRKSNRTAELSAKLMSGVPLTQEERAFLAQNAPGALKDYEELKRKQDSYKNELKHCKSKEDVERVKLSHMGTFMAQAKEIANNPNIPKDKKIELMEKLSKEVNGITETHEEFTKSQFYQDLPDKTEYSSKEESTAVDTDDVEIEITEDNPEDIVNPENTVNPEDTANLKDTTSVIQLMDTTKEAAVSPDNDNKSKTVKIDVYL